MSEAKETKTPNLDQKVVLTLGDLQEMLNYVSSRPYAEVFKVVEVLKKAKTLEAVLKEMVAEGPVVMKDEQANQEA